MRIEDWFLTAAERGNPRYALPDWSVGNAVVPHVHGSAYFARLVDVVSALDPDDHLFFTDWRGDADERMRPEGPTVGTLFGDAAKRGVVVKGLVWRSHHDEMSYSEEQNRHLSDDVNEAGGEVLLDQRVRRAGSHHQKTVVVRAAGQDVAFAGGIDLCHTRRDDAAHHGDPQVVPMAKEYGERPPWHDVQLELRGPVVGLLDGVFRERWDDPRSLDTDNPLSWLKDRLRHVDLTPDPLPAQPPDPPEAGTCAVQVLRTYPAIRPQDPYAPRGERSVARGYRKAFRRARRLMYVEDQYMWSPHIARLLADALTSNPELHVIVVVPRHADVDGRFALPPERGRAAGGDPGRGEGRSGPRARVRPGERRGHTDLRAREGLRRRRRVGVRGQRQPQPPLLEPRRGAVVRGPGRHAGRPGAARPVRARRRRPPLRPRPAADAAARAPRPRRRRRRATCSTRTTPSGP